MADRLLVSERQRGNPLLKHLRNVAWRFEKKLVPDYVVGEKHCAVFISIRYHLLKPSYLSRRLAELKAETWRLRVLLCHVDLDDAAKALHELNVLAVKAEAPVEELRDAPGLGDKKVARLYDAFHVPFSQAAKRKRDAARAP
ncbi:hypothetical protein JL721_11324 [Aureococcus anophagefferens]|nr:hypothetical protein JL721_11324 [Aureococcus anophagefferens]